MASLVLQTVESLIAERALVRPGQVLSELVRLLRGVLQKRSHEAHGSSSHGAGGCGSGLLLNVVRRCVGVEQVTETCRGSVGLHVTECRSWGKGDDGVLVSMYGSTRRACGGRLVAVRAVCADARARICRSRCRKKRGAPVRLGSVSGALESWRRIRKGGSLCTCVITCGEAACSGCRVLLERDSGSSELFGDHAVVAVRARWNVYQPTELALADCPVRVLCWYDICGAAIVVERTT
jgi:hypothetical protein